MAKKSLAARRNPALLRRGFAQRLGPERKLYLTVEGRKRLVSKFGLTESKLRLAAARLDKWKVDNCGSYSLLFCSMRKMFGSFRGKSILELGSATADFASVLKRLGAKPVVLDRVGVNPRAKVEGHEGNFEDIGWLFKGRNFDAVISNWSFGNYPANNQQALYGIYDSLRPRGYLIVSNDRPGDIGKEKLNAAGFKVLLYAQNLGST